MQKFNDRLNETDRKIVRTWRLAALGFYGSLLAGMALFAAMHWNAEVNYASVDSSVHDKVVSAPRH